MNAFDLVTNKHTYNSKCLKSEISENANRQEMLLPTLSMCCRNAVFVFAAHANLCTLRIDYFSQFHATQRELLLPTTRARLTRHGHCVGARRSSTGGVATFSCRR